MDSQTIVNLENVRIQDTKETKIASLNWQMNAGEAWLVIGANGGGKADFLDGLAGTKQILRNKDNSIVNVFDGSAEVVSLERAARLIEEERELDESEYMDKIDEGRTGRRFICEVLGGPDARHRNLPLPAIADRLETGSKTLRNRKNSRPRLKIHVHWRNQADPLVPRPFVKEKTFDFERSFCRPGHSEPHNSSRLF